MSKRKLLVGMLFALIVVMLLASCKPNSPDPKEPSDTASDDPVIKVVLIGNQRFGDNGPMDSMAHGLERSAKDFGFEVKKIESDTSAKYEEDIRGMAKEGYDLILTTFSPMAEPTKKMAAEFPDVKFAAIYQFINVDGNSIPNIWDTEYRGEQAFYLLGAISAKLSESKKVGFVEGSEQPTNNAQMNGFIRGVKDTDPNCEVVYSYVGSFEDPAKAREIALAMIESGVDVLQTDCGNSQIGVIEAAKEKGVLVSGDVADNSDMYPEGFFGFVGVEFGANVYEACRLLKEGSFPGGEHGYMNLENGGYYVPYETLESFAERNPDYADKMTDAIKLSKDLTDQIIAGDLVIEFDTSVPEK